jgi:hypothetical protein
VCGSLLNLNTGGSYDHGSRGADEGLAQHGGRVAGARRGDGVKGAQLREIN